MALARDPQIGFETRLRHVATAADLPPAVDQLRQRLRDFQRATAGNAMRERLAAAIVTNDAAADRELLWACALAEAAASPPLVADLREFVRVRINRAVREVYADVAVPTYRAIAAQFDSAAQALATAAALADVEAPAEVAIAFPAKQQQAWRDAERHAADLTRLTLSLKSAAVLAGICDDDADNDLPLCVDPGDAHRREVWRAWETDNREERAERKARSNQGFTTGQPVTRSRTGRWGALLRLGVTLRACPPDAFTTYRRPAPLIEQTVHVDGHNQRVTVDPEDPGYQPAPPMPKGLASPRIRVARTH